MTDMTDNDETTWQTCLVTTHLDVITSIQRINNRWRLSAVYGHHQIINWTWTLVPNINLTILDGMLNCATTYFSHKRLLTTTNNHTTRSLSLGVSVLCSWPDYTLSHQVFLPDDQKSMTRCVMSVLCSWPDYTLSHRVFLPDDQKSVTRCVSVVFLTRLHTLTPSVPTRRPEVCD